MLKEKYHENLGQQYINIKSGSKSKAHNVKAFWVENGKFDRLGGETRFLCGCVLKVSFS
jgi:hypothetical protein